MKNYFCTKCNWEGTEYYVLDGYRNPCNGIWQDYTCPECGGAAIETKKENKIVYECTQCSWYGTETGNYYWYDKLGTYLWSLFLCPRCGAFTEKIKNEKNID